MQKEHVQIGRTYIVKVSGSLARVRLTREHPRSGWYGTNLASGREIRIRTAARLRSEVATPGAGRIDQISNLRTEGISYAVAKELVDKIDF